MSGQEREESKGFYEMLWDCQHCGAKGLLGKSQRYCPECGGPQNADKRYYPAPTSRRRPCPATSYEGADAYCPSCNAPMGAKVKNCTQCGSPMDGSKVVTSADDRVPKPAPKKTGFPIWIVVVLLALAAAIFLVWFMFFRKREAEMTITKHRWERRGRDRAVRRRPQERVDATSRPSPRGRRT